MKRGKWIALLSIVVMLSLSLAACGGNEQGEAPANGKQGGKNQEGKTTLRVAWWGSQYLHDTTQQVVKLYEEQNPGIKIEMEFADFNAYVDRLSTQAAGGNMPDVVNMGSFLSEYAERGLLHDLTEFVESGLIDMSDVNPVVTSNGTFFGQLAGISVGQNALAVFYDQKLFEKANLNQPELGWTWDDYIGAARELKKQGLVEYGFTLATNRDLFDYYVRQRGYQWFNEQRNGLGFDDDQILIDYFQMLHSMVKEGIIPPPDVNLEYNMTNNSMLVHGMAGMMVGAWSNTISDLNDSAQRPILMAAMPGPGEDKGMYLKESQYWSIPNSSKNKEEAAKFINFFNNSVEANTILAAGRGVPINATVREGIRDKVDPSVLLSFDYIELLSSHSSPKNFNLPLTFQENVSIYTEIEEKVLFGLITPEEAAKEFRTRSENLLSQ
ncbi:ABC transporter substrate-binding protein [Paenibacillus sp. MSJ-34]|uniref:ABC transporter substrate-binding protein n=1 Tax=Paenibacillus sp. MSJ-34 TaxID=2841529 RepID=UPI001C0FF6C6|nr:sugar ABC transporter substrate-binding protein [Paenibacillus sp. MSJ-34]MBU5445001.1 sugar ABC transporter substrate-binding protein [Paenibacillus sp. MSJ-34]